MLDLGETIEIHGIRFTPRQETGAGRIKDYHVYAGSKPVDTESA